MSGSARFVAVWSLGTLLLCAAAAWINLAMPARRPASDGRLMFEPAALSVRARDATPRPHRLEPRLVNRSDRTIRVKSLKTGCSCTSVGELSKFTLAPGESVVVPLIVTPPGAGLRDIGVRIETDDPEQPLVQLVIRTEGPELPLPILVASPPELRLSGRRAGEVLSEFIALQTHEEVDSSPWIEGLETENGEFQIEAIPVEEESAIGGQAVQRTYRFRVRVVCPDEIGRRRETDLTYRLSTATGESPPPVHASVVREPLIRAYPDAVHLVLANGSTSIQRTLIMECSAPSHWTLTPPDRLPEGLSVVLLEPLEGESETTKRLRLRFDRGMSNEPEERSSQVVVPFATSLRDQPVVNVQVALITQPGQTPTE